MSSSLGSGFVYWLLSAFFSGLTLGALAVYFYNTRQMQCQGRQLRELRAELEDSLHEDSPSVARQLTEVMLTVRAKLMGFEQAASACLRQRRLEDFARGSKGAMVEIRDCLDVPLRRDLTNLRAGLVLGADIGMARHFAPGAGRDREQAGGRDVETVSVEGRRAKRLER